MMFNRQHQQQQHNLLLADVINGGEFLFQPDFGNFFPAPGLPLGLAGGGGDGGFPAGPARKRPAAKPDRHSKINTSQGLRDRHVRLSIGIARRFFDLQEMLGFDKPSKTLDWLLTKSTSAIKELVQQQEENDAFQSEKTKLGHNSKGKSAAAECGSGADEKRGSITGKNRQFHYHQNQQQQQQSAVKESRAKARARARARTREKMINQIMNPNPDLNPMIPIQYHHHHHHLNNHQIHEICRISGCNSSMGRKTTKVPPIWGLQQNENWDFTSHSHPIYAIWDQAKFFNSCN